MHDELMDLWQESAMPAPDRAEIARLAGRAAMSRFDRTIRSRNLREYGAGFGVIAFFGWQLAHGRFVELDVAAIAAVLFVLGFLWNHHRHIAPLDPSTCASDYQAAMLSRIDSQIRLLSSIRYWYLLPFYVPIVWVTVIASRRSLIVAGLFFLLATLLYAVIAWLNEKVGVQHLIRQRTRIEALFEANRPVPNQAGPFPTPNS